MSVLSTIETDTAEVTEAATASTPVLQAATATTAGSSGGGGGGGGGGGLDREGSKGVPAGHMLPITSSWVPRRPGLGCGGVSGSSCGGHGLGWMVVRGETAAY